MLPKNDLIETVNDELKNIAQTEYSRRRLFNSVDNVGNQHHVFNIRGNNYRLVVVIKFTIKTVLIRFIGTHVEYDKLNVKNV